MSIRTAVDPADTPVGAPYTAVMGGWPLTGRVEELAVIAASTRAAGVVLAGAAGVGKTRLAREALTRASRRGGGSRFVVATASAQSVPLGAFGEYAGHLGPDPLARVRDVVDAVTHRIGAQPVVIGVDDAHLLDEQSALVVHQIVCRHLASVVLTVRTGERAPDAITALWKDELLPRLEVQPLSKTETAALLEAVLGGQVESSTVDTVWNHTRGNALYLRQLVADELGSGRLFQRSDVWVWDAQLEVSATLAELIDATIGQQSPPVHEVLDVLAVADPVELGVLGQIAGASAIDDAETHGLITVDTLANPPMARLAHPMFGEVRRIRAGTMRLRHLRSTVAAKLPPLDDPPDPVSVVRRAVLLADSDTPPCPELLVEGATAALRLSDATTAERLARKAVDAGGGEKAKWLHVNALVNCDRLHEALAVNASLIDAAPTEHARVLLTAARAAILSRNWEIDRAEAELASVRETAIALGLMRPYSCVAALLQAIRGRAESAVEAATRGLTAPGWINDFFELVGVTGMVAGLRELGRVEEMQQAVERGYRLSRASLHSPTMRYALGVLHLDALRLSGLLRAQRQAADTLADEPMDDAFARTHRALFEGMTAMALGDLAAARNWLRETLATGAARETTWIGSLARLWLATVMSMSGDHDGARTILAVPDPSDRPDPFRRTSSLSPPAGSGLAREPPAKRLPSFFGVRPEPKPQVGRRRKCSACRPRRNTVTRAARPG